MSSIHANTCSSEQNEAHGKEKEKEKLAVIIHQQEQITSQNREREKKPLLSEFTPSKTNVV